MAELYDEMQQALSKFSRLNPKAYMVFVRLTTTTGCGGLRPPRHSQRPSGVADRGTKAFAKSK